MRPDPLSFLTAELDTLREQGLHRSLRILEEPQQATTRFDGREVVNLSSNTKGLGNVYPMGYGRV
jgi:7-keto-8-aminopelargonate synthetase-like enzyme